MVFDRLKEDSLVNPEIEKYPKTIDELSQEVFTLLTAIGAALKQNGPEDSRVHDDLREGYRIIAGETIKLFQHQDAKANSIKNWKEGLGKLRDAKQKHTITAIERHFEINQLTRGPKEERIKLFHERLRGVEARVKKLSKDGTFSAFLKNIKRDYMRAVSNDNIDEELKVWKTLNELDKFSGGNLLWLDDLVRDIFKDIVFGEFDEDE